MKRTVIMAAGLRDLDAWVLSGMFGWIDAAVLAPN
jgi:hypothetical protein